MAAYLTPARSALDRLYQDEDLPRALIVAAHPDDEVIGLGSRLARFSEVALIEVTDGAPRDLQDARAHGFASAEEYAAARRSELEEAFQVAGVRPRPWVSLGIPDQQAALHLAQMADQIAAVVDRFRPELVLTHPYEGGHPDHDACAFAVNAVVPEVAEFASYHLHNGNVRTGCFLNNGELGRPLWLRPEQREQKRRMFECFATQRETLRMFDISVESFRMAPRYRFDQRPHEGELHYERYPWGMTGARFCELVKEAGVCA